MKILFGILVVNLHKCEKLFDIRDMLEGLTSFINFRMSSILNARLKKSEIKGKINYLSHQEKLKNELL